MECVCVLTEGGFLSLSLSLSLWFLSDFVSAANRVVGQRPMAQGLTPARRKSKVCFALPFEITWVIQLTNVHNSGRNRTGFL